MVLPHDCSAFGPWSGLTRFELEIMLGQMEQRLEVSEKRTAEVEAENAKLKGKNAKLKGENAKLKGENAKLKGENAKLKAQIAAAKKNSSNSSKPPSSDITKPKSQNADDKNGSGNGQADGKGDNAGQNKGDGRRKKGGQKGHPKHERPAFTPDQVNKPFEYRLDACPCCGGDLELSDADPRVRQQVEIPELPLDIEEHRSLAFWCDECQKTHYAELPEHITKGGLTGPRLATYIAYLKGKANLSYTQIHELLVAQFGLHLSRGMLAKVIQKVSDAIAADYEKIADMIADQPTLHVDETGHPNNGKQRWTWVFRAVDMTLFHIGSRGAKELQEVLGEHFAGTIGCDYYSSYRKFIGESNAAMQFCLAHLIRDLKFLADYPDEYVRTYGQRLLNDMEDLFRIIHERERYPDPADFQAALERQKVTILQHAASCIDTTGPAATLSKRLAKHGEAYFTFITTPGIEPTNNLAEQALRFVVIQRKLTQGTRSERGETWCQRIWTIIATCKQQGRSVWQYLYEAIGRHFRGDPPEPIIFPNAQPA